MDKILSISAKQTQKVGEILAKELLAKKNSRKEARIICLSGNLGSGKTTFVQGLLKGLSIPGPYTSPTFVIMKKYKTEFQNPNFQIPNKSKALKPKIKNIYHLDAYRVEKNDILSLGWEEIVKNKDNIIIVEWAEKIKKIIPKDSLWIKLEWVGENKREIRFKAKL